MCYLPDDFDFEENFLNSFREQAEIYIPENDNDFVLNQQNYTKLLVLCGLLKSIANPEFDRVNPVELVPRHRNACVEADFDGGILLNGQQKKNFETCINISDDIDFTVVDGILHLEFLIKDVFDKQNTD
ncbi:MAG: hypothetical protein J6T96_05255 [Bacteroidales bacterium]|nr:hypothetical protein [Bacteroidales bacterium]